MLLHNYCQKTYRFAVERFHAMWKFGVKINAVALVEDDFLAFDVDKHTSFEYEVELLTVMLVVWIGASSPFGSTVTMNGSAVRFMNPAARDWYL